MNMCVSEAQSCKYSHPFMSVIAHREREFASNSQFLQIKVTRLLAK